MYARKAYHGTETTSQLVITCRNAPQLFEPANATLDGVTLTIFRFIKSTRESGAWFTPHPALRNDGLHMMAVAIPAQCFAIISLIRHHVAATLSRPPPAPGQVDALQGGDEVAGVSVLPRRQAKGQGPTVAITHQMNFGRQSATAAAQRMI